MTPRRAAASFALALLLLAAPCAFAEDVPLADWGQQAIRAVDNSFSAAYDSLNLDYAEPSDGGTSDKYYDTERGRLSDGGESVALSFLRDAGSIRDLYVQSSFSRATGEVPYDGHTYLPFSNVLVPFRATTDEHITDWSLRVGKGFAWGTRFLFTPYISYGYRTWERRLQAGTYSAFEEDYRHHEIGFGDRLQFAACRRLVLTADAEFGATLWPHINVPSQQLSEGLGSAPVIRLAAEADFALWKALHAYLGYQYTYFSYGQSAVDASGDLEPMSTTEQRSFLAGLRFSY